MSVQLKTREFQIALLKLYREFRELDRALASHAPLPALLQRNPDSHAARQRRRAEQELRRLKAQIKYLERYAYIERVREGNKRLYRLTAKGTYEILRLRFVEHMMEERERKWDGVWRIMIFDIPEEKRKYRDFMRRLLKDNGFEMWQFSVWVTKHNPEPSLRALLKYLGLHKYYSIIEADYKKCSPHLVRTWNQMRRKREDVE